jgi:hypothetical protein
LGIAEDIRKYAPARCSSTSRTRQGSSPKPCPLRRRYVGGRRLQRGHQYENALPRSLGKDAGNRPESGRATLDTLASTTSPGTEVSVWTERSSGPAFSGLS